MSKLYLAIGPLLLAAGILILTGVFDPIGLSGGRPTGCTGNSCDAGQAGVWAAGGVLVVIGVVFCLIGWFFASTDRNYARLRRNGIRATATVRAVHRTSIMVNREPLASIELDVVTPTEQFTGTCSTVVPLVYLARLVPGGELPVIVDPGDHTNMIIDWDRQPSGEPAAAEAF